MSDIVQQKAGELAKAMANRRKEIFDTLLRNKNIDPDSKHIKLGQELLADGVLYTFEGTPFVKFDPIQFEQTGDQLKASQPYKILV